MSDVHDREFLEFCRQMRAWPEQLAARLKDFPKIGLHFKGLLRASRCV